MAETACAGKSANVCVAEGCFGKACVKPVVKHLLKLDFVDNGKNTRVSCTCGKTCGKVLTGTKPAPIQKMFRKHLENG